MIDDKMKESLSELYEEYKLKYNGNLKHDFPHFIRVMAEWVHHREIIKPQIK